MKRTIFAIFTLLLLVTPAWAEDSDAPISLEVSVSKNSVYVGEPLFWKCCLWRSINLAGNPIYIPPATAGFMSLTAPQRYVDKKINGRQYLGSEISMFLIPQFAGNISVGGVQVHVPRSSINVMALVEYADFFKDLFKNTTSFQGGATDEALLVSPEINLQVKPLPLEGQPPCFSGAVGEFTASASLDRTEARADEPITLNLTVQGEGNVALIDPPAGASFKGFRLLQQRSQGGFTPFALVGEDARLAGTALIHMAKPEGKRTFSYVLMAQNPGEYQIVPPSIAYFNPETGSYHTLDNAPLSVHILPSLNGKPLPLGPQLLDITQVGGGWRERDLPEWFPFLLLSPLMALVFLRLKLRLHRWQVRDMRKFLERGSTLTELWELWCKVHVPNELNYAQVEQAMRNWGASREQVDKLRRLLGDMDAVRFGNQSVAAATSEQATEELLQLLHDLDTLFQKSLGIREHRRQRMALLFPYVAHMNQVALLKNDIVFPGQYGYCWKKILHFRRFIALVLTITPSIYIICISIVWMEMDYRSQPALLQAKQLFVQGDLPGAERFTEEAFAINGRYALLDYNKGCIAWQRGEYYRAHYLFSRACYRSVGQSPECVQAWRDSAAKLKLSSWDPPRRTETIMPFWLLSVASFMFLFFSIIKKKFGMFMAFYKVTFGTSLFLYMWLSPTVVIMNGEGVVRSGPGYNYPAEATVRQGAMAVIIDERDGYVRLQSVAGQDDFYEADEVIPKAWVPDAGVSTLDSNDESNVGSNGGK